MLIQVNGEKQEVAAGTTVAGLLTVLKITADRVAVERNRLVVRRGTYDETVLEQGDEIEILFSITQRPTTRAYLISVADKLRIDILNQTDNNRDVQVQVRPDGQISMPLIGSVMAAGKTPDALTRQLEQRYARELVQPQITINVAEAHSRLQDFVDALGPSVRSRTIVDKVLPDGTVSLPLLRPIQARGRTLRDLKRDIVYKNDEMYNLMRALDIEDNIERLRYDKVILATDADVDGLHIRNLLITYFFKFFESLVHDGHLYVLETPPPQ